MGKVRRGKIRRRKLNIVQGEFGKVHAPQTRLHNRETPATRTPLLKHVMQLYFFGHIRRNAAIASGW